MPMTVHASAMAERGEREKISKARPNQRAEVIPEADNLGISGSPRGGLPILLSGLVLHRL
jgi:hypothetical protein